MSEPLSISGRNKSYTRENVAFDEEVLKLTGGSSFLMTDDETGDRIAIFAGEKGKGIHSYWGT